MAMVFQQVALLPFRNVLENVCLPLEVLGTPKEKRIEISRSALEKVGLGDWLGRYPSELSGGMQQRVGLARALAADTEVILMDEPFSALDPLIRRQLQTEFMQLSAQLRKTTVFITHDLEEAIRIGSRIVIMKEGRIVQIGTPEEIVLRPVDAYVAEFVEGISRLHLIKAHSVMVGLDRYAAEQPGVDPSTLKKVDAETELKDLIATCLDEGHEALAIGDDGGTIGVVTRDSLMSGVLGREQQAARAI